MRPALLFPLVAMVVVGLTWGLLSAAHRMEVAPSGRVVKMTKTASLLAGGEEMGRGWWEEQRFAEYARKRGWDIRLKVKTTVGDYVQKYVASAVAGEAPDTIQLDPQEVAYWYDHGLLEPLDQYVEAWDAYRQGHINQEVLRMCRGVSGELLCLAWQRHGPAMFGVRRDWLERLGLKAPSTWAEAYEVWKAFTYDDPDGNGVDDTYGFCIDMGTAQGEHTGSIQAFLFPAGVRWFGKTPDGRIRPAFNVPAAVETLEFVKRCYKEGLFGRDVMYRTERTYVVQRFLAEKNAGMTFAIFPNFYKSLALREGMYDKVELIPFLWKDRQAREKGIYGTYTFLSGPRCLLKTSRDKDAAWKFLEYWNSAEAVAQGYSKRGNARERYFGRFGLYTPDAPWIPLRNDVPVTAKVDPWIEKLARPLDKYVVPQPYIATWSRMSRAIAEVFVDYYLDRYPSAQAALDEAERRCLRIMDEYDRELRQAKRRGAR